MAPPQFHFLETQGQFQVSEATSLSLESFLHVLAGAWGLAVEAEFP